MLVWLRRAIADRDAQLEYIAQDNPYVAIEQGDRMAHQVGQLVQHPEMGRAGRKQGTRELVISRTPFIVVYRIKGKRIELLRVLHGAQQWPNGDKNKMRKQIADATTESPLMLLLSVSTPIEF